VQRAVLPRALGETVDFPAPAFFHSRRRIYAAIAFCPLSHSPVFVGATLGKTVWHNMALFESVCRSRCYLNPCNAPKPWLIVLRNSPAAASRPSDKATANPSCRRRGIHSNPRSCAPHTSSVIVTPLDVVFCQPLRDTSMQSGESSWGPVATEFKRACQNQCLRKAITFDEGSLRRESNPPAGGGIVLLATRGAVVRFAPARGWT